MARRIRLLIDGGSEVGRRTTWLVAVLCLIVVTVPVSGFVRFSISRAVPASPAVLDHTAVHQHGHR